MILLFVQIYYRLQKLWWFVIYIKKSLQKKTLIYIVFKKRNPDYENKFTKMLKKDFIFTEINFEKNIKFLYVYIYKIYDEKD